MKRTILAFVAALTVTGCATGREYQLYAETQQKIAQAQAQAFAASEAARYAALSEIAKNGDATSRVAAAMSLSFGAQGPKQPLSQPQVLPPENMSDRALRWAGVLLPSLTQMYGISANRQIAITQSNNQAAIAQNTNNTFAAMNANMANSNAAIANYGLAAVGGIADTALTASGAIAAVGLNTASTIAGNGLTATTTTATNGLMATVVTANNGLTATTSVSSSGLNTITAVNNATNASLQALTNQLPALQPTVINNNCGSGVTGGTVTCPK